MKCYFPSICLTKLFFIYDHSGFWSTTSTGNSEHWYGLIVMSWLRERLALIPVKTGENKDLKWAILVYFLFTLQILTGTKLFPDLIWNVASDQFSYLDGAPVVNFQILTFTCKCCGGCFFKNYFQYYVSVISTRMMTLVMGS